MYSGVWDTTHLNLFIFPRSLGTFPNIFIKASLLKLTALSRSISSVHLLTHVQVFVTPRTAACQASLSIINSRSWPKLMSIELVRPSNHLILCRPPPLPPRHRITKNQLTAPKLLYALPILPSLLPSQCMFSKHPSGSWSGNLLDKRDIGRKETHFWEPRFCLALCIHSLKMRPIWHWSDLALRTSFRRPPPQNKSMALYNLCHDRIQGNITNMLFIV